MGEVPLAPGGSVLQPALLPQRWAIAGGGKAGFLEVLDVFSPSLSLNIWRFKHFSASLWPLRQSHCFSESSLWPEIFLRWIQRFLKVACWLILQLCPAPWSRAPCELLPCLVPAFCFPPFLSPKNWDRIGEWLRPPLRAETAGTVESTGIYWMTLWGSRPVLSCWNGTTLSIFFCRREMGIKRSLGDLRS